MVNRRQAGFSKHLCLLVFFLGSLAVALAQGPLYQEGLELACEGDFAQARKVFSEAVNQNPTDFSSQGALQVLDDISAKKISSDYALTIFKSMRLLLTGSMEEALEWLQRAVGLNAAYPKAYNVMGVIYASRQETEKALEYLKKAVEVDAGYAEGYYNLASVYQSMGKAEEAAENFKRYVELRPSAVDGRINLALTYASRAKYDEAIKQCREALRIDPRCADAYFNMGLSYFMLDEYMKSRENLIKAQELYSKQGNELGLESVKTYLDKFTEVEEKAKASLKKKE
jgi:tetratricopeptide (TPR) repeat protein